MRKDINAKLLKEEVSRFKRILEYSFYTGPDNLDEDDAEDDASTPPADGETDPKAAADAIGGDLGLDSTEPPADGAATGDTPPAPAADAPPAAPAADAPPADGLGNGMDAPMDAPMQDDSVEVDVTSLVKGNKETKHAADLASSNSVALMAKFNELENQVAKMGGITQKIDALEKEIIKRNPTNVEKLEMQSLHSFPYSVKLSDYWNDKEGPYDVTTPEEEFILTQDDVDSSYNESSIKNSFKQMPNNLYEEEDI